MPSDGAPEHQLRQACADLDRRLRAGEPCRAEQYFARAPLLASHDDWALELIYTEFVTREEIGHRPTPEEYYARFPTWRDRLSRQFQVHQLLRDGLAAEAVAPLPPAGPGPGDRFGPYELLDEVARGGCGVVYRAWQAGLDRVVAVKALRPELGRLLPARRRFCREARVMASLRHRHIMPVHDIGESQGVLYFSMNWAPRSLAMHRPAGARAVAVVALVARAVHHAHEHGVIHCDLKPSNVLLDEAGEPLVSDFGLARAATPESADAAVSEIAGTPAYMAPEQLGGRSESLAPATDVWALGAILYELLTGHRPFTADTLLGLQEAVCGGGVPPFARHGADSNPGLEAVCRRCLAADPAQRFPSAAELARALSPWLED